MPRPRAGAPAETLMSKTSIRLKSGTLVSPAMKAPPRIHPELGVEEKRFPGASTTSTAVVSPGSRREAAGCACGA